MNSRSREFDDEVRAHIYDCFIRTARAPTMAETAQALNMVVAEVRKSYRRLADDHVLALQDGSGEVLMAEPFSAVPTAFSVESEGRHWWANCIWDALGIPAMLDQDARIMTSCGDCGDEMTVRVTNGELASAEGVVHLAVTAKLWWDDIVFA